MTLIECKGLNLHYDNHQAVKDVSFSVNEGDYLCIVGENGSGKSTLLKGLLGLRSPSSGSILFNGIRQTQIGYLPQQNPVQNDFPASVFEVVLSGCLGTKRLNPFYGRKDKNIVQGFVRRTAAKSAACQSPLCNRKAFIAG